MTRSLKMKLSQLEEMTSIQSCETSGWLMFAQQQLYFGFGCFLLFLPGCCLTTLVVVLFIISTLIKDVYCDLCYVTIYSLCI